METAKNITDKAEHGGKPSMGKVPILMRLISIPAREPGPYGNPKQAYRDFVKLRIMFRCFGNYNNECRLEVIRLKTLYVYSHPLTDEGLSNNGD